MTGSDGIWAATAGTDVTELGRLTNRFREEGSGRPVRFLHAADLHLGAPLESLGSRLPPEVAKAYRRRVTETFSRLVQTARDEQVDVVFLAGDIYDQADRETAAQIRFSRGLRELSDAGIRTFIVHGNHDPLAAEFRSAAPLPEHVHVFGPGTPQTVAFEVGGQRVAVTGVSFSSVRESANLVRAIAAAPVDADLRVGLVHANVDGIPGHDAYAGCSTADLVHSPIHYWALGHIHGRTVTPMGPGRWWAYPGNLQGRSTKATECGAKGVLVVDAAAGGFAEPRFRACDAVRFASVEVPVDGARTAEEALELAAEAVARLVSDAEGRPLVARVALTGETDAHAGLTSLRSDDLDDLLMVEGAHIVRFRVATTRRVDRRRLAEQHDLLGAVSARLQTLAGDGDALRSLLDRCDAAGSPALQRVRVALDTGRLAATELVAEAERLVVNALAGAGTVAGGGGPGADDMSDGEVR